MYMKSWVSCCSPWEEGGFNIKEILSWNKANLCKWIWLLINPTDSLWSVWNSAYNLKFDNIWTVKVKPHHCESCRGILHTRDFLLQVFGTADIAALSLSSCVSTCGKFQISKIYDLIRPHYAKVTWAPVIQNPNVLPKHRFICSLAFQKKLPTVGSLGKRGICMVNRCVLCKCALETHTHLFFKCDFSSALWRCILGWMRIYDRSNDLWKELPWCLSRYSRKHWKGSWYRSCISATIWLERNSRTFAGKETSLLVLVQQIQFQVGVRLLDRNIKANEEILTHLHSI
ncbi:uncharacterized protein LOC141617715 [Silene latifolia]|uniref:uncharacterized protein LOC141617715 n=1 Tax=Silene latifolia TaxID=37657 RepID=UPI003D78646E